MLVYHKYEVKNVLVETLVENDIAEAGEMAQWLKSFRCKNEDLNLDPQNPQKLVSVTSGLGKWVGPCGQLEPAQLSQ